MLLPLGLRVGGREQGAHQLRVHPGELGEVVRVVLLPLLRRRALADDAEASGRFIDEGALVSLQRMLAAPLGDKREQRRLEASAIRTIIRLRKKDPNERQEEEALVELYMNALGMA